MGDMHINQPHIPGFIPIPNPNPGDNFFHYQQVVTDDDPEEIVNPIGEDPRLPCPAERKGPFEVPSLKKIALSYIHKNLHIQTKRNDHSIWKNVTVNGSIYRNLPLPYTLKETLDTLLTNCIRHQGGHCMTINLTEKKLHPVYIKKFSPLYHRLKKDSVFDAEDFSEYHFRFYLWYKLRTNYSDEEIQTSIIKEISESLGFRRNWQ